MLDLPTPEERLTETKLQTRGCFVLSQEREGLTLNCESPSKHDRSTARCMSCGYDLRGSIGAICCPECGERLDRIRPLWTLERRAWVGIQVAVVLLIAIVNVLAHGPGIGDMNPIEAAERFLIVWGVTFAIGVVSLVGLTGLQRIPPTMIVIPLFILIIAVLAAAINAFAWFVILTSV